MKNETINQRIKLVRKEFCNNKNKEFAITVGEKENTVNNWVRDGYSVGRGVASKIAEQFNININWLLTGDGKMKKEIPPLGSYDPPNIRIKKIIQYFCENSVEKFAEIIGEEEETINKGIESGVNMYIYAKIHAKFPEINSLWLNAGIGEMLDERKILVNKLHDAYNHLCSLNIINTKEELAVATGCSEHYLLSAFNGKDFVEFRIIFAKICEKYYDIFNVEYFLYGKGEMLKSSNISVSEGWQEKYYVLSDENKKLSAELIALQKKHIDMLEKDKELSKAPLVDEHPAAAKKGVGVEQKRKTR
jgi:hypothetical protein